MNSFVDKYPKLKLFSLPRLDERRTIELGMKGDATLAEQAIIEIKAEITSLGFAWSELKK